MNCYIFEDEEFGVVGVMSCSELGARFILNHDTNLDGENAILLDCISEDDEFFDETLDSYGCDVL